MKTLVVAIALALLAFPAIAMPVDPLPDLLDELFGWLVAAWEEIGPMIDPSGAPEEIGPGLDPIGSSGE